MIVPNGKSREHGAGVKLGGDPWWKKKKRITDNIEKCARKYIKKSFYIPK